MAKRKHDTQPRAKGVTIPSTPVEVEGHPAYHRIDLAHLATYQISVVLGQLLKHLADARMTSGEESFVPLALASRARRLSRAAARLLSEPADEINLEECEGEVLHG